MDRRARRGGPDGWWRASHFPALDRQGQSRRQRLHRLPVPLYNLFHRPNRHAVMDHPHSGYPDAGLCELLHPHGIRIHAVVVHALFQIRPHDLPDARAGVRADDLAGGEGEIGLIKFLLYQRIMF